MLNEYVAKVLTYIYELMAFYAKVHKFYSWLPQITFFCVHEELKSIATKGNYWNLEL